jgi:hypothetical protein
MASPLQERHIAGTELAAAGAIAKSKKAAEDVGAANIAALPDGLSSASIVEVKVLSGLPNTATTVDEDAKFVRVTVTATTSSIFPFTPYETFTTTAVAVN